jgi:8-oxo-dGTP pyrophosphatase MutT (NUDIX family)
MDGFSVLDPLAWDPCAIKFHPAYLAGNTAGWLSKSGAVTGTDHYLSGRLYVSKSGYLLLSVPNALVRGVFDAMTAPGVELPTMNAFKGEAADKELLNAHITVMTDAEVDKIGPDKINERGHHFHYALGPVREFSPKTESLSRVWAIQVASPELAALRKSYGLSALPNGDHQFHITVAVRRKNVLGANEVAKIDGSRGELKAAADHTVTYDCGCSGPCSCPDTCICKQSGRCGAAHKAAATEKLPWRERAEVYARDPNTGKLYGGKWDNDGSFALPGGGIDPGEDPATAALRELEEETGIKATNARVLPIPAVDSPWSDAVRAEKAKQGRGNFAGSRTHFVAADIVNHPKRDGLDYWAAKDRGYYDPADALKIMQGVKKFNVPSIANARMAAINHLIAEASKKQAAAVKDVLSGGEADHKPDSEFPQEALAEGKKHEREHTDNAEVAEEIAKDHLSEDPAYYEKAKALEKLSNSVYLNQAFQALNPATIGGLTPYDPSKPVFENIHHQLAEAKNRGDFILQSQRNYQMWRAAQDPQYRYQLAMQAVRGDMPQPSVFDQAIERYGDQAAASLGFGPGR